ncbi:hypothetical protein JZ785_26995 [Alicyclobacillus curvatus]|nr:hypothetical protein JZ785_26995 [Alicyclobacillus curvatus]
MTQDELEQLLDYDRENENDWIFVPNEIFTDFTAAFESTPHIAFAFSYYYLILYLYYFTKYDAGRWNKFDVKTIKEILGYSRTDKKLDYIIKKNGILDEIGYTESNTDYPIERIWGDIEELSVPHIERTDNKEISFVTYSGLLDETKSRLHKEYGNPPRIKVPLKGFDRDCDEYEGCGTFFSFEHTTRVSVEVFLKCMTDESLGPVGFYLYSWLKYKCEYYGGDFVQTLPDISHATGMARSTLNKYLQALEGNNMIEIVHQRFDLSLPERQRQPNRYRVHDWREFIDVTVMV